MTIFFITIIIIKKLNLKLVSKFDVDTHNVFRCVKFENQDWENVLGSKRLLLKSLHVANNRSFNGLLKKTLK